MSYYRAALLVSTADKQFKKAVFWNREATWVEENYISSLQENSKVILKIFFYDNGEVLRHSAEKKKNQAPGCYL